MIFGKSEPKSESKAKPETGNPAAAGTAASSAALAAAAASAPGPAKPAAGPTKPAPGQAAASAAPGEQQAAALRYVDRPDIAETFADSISGVVFDGQTLRIEFTVTRVDDVKPGAPPTGRRYPACRLVLAPTAAVELINRMQQIAAALTRAGVARAAPPAGEGQKKG